MNSILYVEKNQIILSGETLYEYKHPNISNTVFVPENRVKDANNAGYNRQNKKWTATTNLAFRMSLSLNFVNRTISNVNEGY